MRIVLLLALVLAGCGVSTKCTSKADCFTNEVCSGGICQALSGAGGGSGSGGGGGGAVFAENQYLCSCSQSCPNVSANSISGLVCAKSATEASQAHSAKYTKNNCSCSPTGCTKYQDGC